jgi:hypothetical protein
MSAGRSTLLICLALAACSPSMRGSLPVTASATMPLATTPARGTQAAPTPFLFVDEPVIVRTGPGVVFPVTTEIPSQQNYRVIGKNVSWWLVELGANRMGWIYGEVNTTNFIGDPESVPEIEAPPTPTAQPTPTCRPNLNATAVPSQRIEAARSTLTQFFDLLNAGQYHAAADIYAGDYEVLRDNNPLVGPDDHAGLLRNACQINGYQCLKLSRVVGEMQMSPGEYQFTVEFINADGTTFERGQCCGASETDMPSQSQFTYTVRAFCPGAFYVMDMPVYVP